MLTLPTYLGSHTPFSDRTQPLDACLLSKTGASLKLTSQESSDSKPAKVTEKGRKDYGGRVKKDSGYNFFA